MWNDPQYWLAGNRSQNFGDYLSEFFLNSLFYSTGFEASAIRIVGSCIDDGLLGPDRVLQWDGTTKQMRTVFWGCGLRHEHSLSERCLEHVEILAVRGPLTRSALRLGLEVPMGDPGLLLPALYQPTVNSSAQTLLIPHFLDTRSDKELLALSGCDAVLRPNVVNDLASVADFIDRIVAADFVLCGSMHAAIAAAAYGRGFAFWASGSIDLPFKWEDFAASVSIPCEFQASIETARRYYAKAIKPNINIPVLWPLLAVAPLVVRPDALARVIEQDISRHGLDALKVAIPSRVSRRMHAEIIARNQQVARMFNKLTETNGILADTQNVLLSVRENLRAVQQARDEALARASDKLRSTERERDEALRLAQDNQDALERARAMAVAEAQDNRRALERARAEADAARRERDEVLYSHSWKLMAPMREFGRSYPALMRLMIRCAKFVYWTATLQIGHRYKLWRERNASISALAAAQAELARSMQSDNTAPSQAPAPLQAEAMPHVTDLKEAFVSWHGKAPIHFPPVEAPEVSIIIPVYRGLSDLENCFRSLCVHMATEPSFEVILVDDCPLEPVLWAVPNSGGIVKLSNKENLGFLLTCNRGARAARGKYLCLLNSDTIVSPGWLRPLVEALEDTPDAALAGGMLLNTDGTIQDAGWRILNSGWGYPIGRGRDPRDGAYTYRRAVDCVTGACFLMSRELFGEMGGFDEAYAPAFYEEFDLAFRARQRGLKVIYEPRSRVLHLGSASYGEERRNELSLANHAKFVKRFANQLQKQPWGSEGEFSLLESSVTGPVMLVVDYGVPQPNRHAGDVTMSSYLSLLAAAGWRVIFCPMDGRAEGLPAEGLERQGVMLVRAPITIERWLEDNGRHVAEVWLARPEIADKVIPAVRAYTRARVSYYTHDLHHVRLEREALLHDDAALMEQAARMKELELAVFRNVDHVTSPSAAEAEIIEQLVPGKAVTVLPPYYFEGRDIHSHDASHFEGLTDIVFVGGFPHTPNVDAALYIANEIMPLVFDKRPEARLVLVGYAPPPEVMALAGPRVIVTGQVPDVKPYLDRARLLLAALRYGAGVKGKTVEAMRLGVPVVSTQVGIEGIGVTPGCEAIVAEGAQELAHAVLELLADAHRCAAQSAAGAALVARNYSRATARHEITKVFKTPRCGVCGSGNLPLLPKAESIREAFVCNSCYALARTEALARVVLARLAREAEGSLAELARRRADIRVHEFGFAGGISDTLRGRTWFTVSEYFDGVALGSTAPGGVRCEDVTALTFADNSFDLAISQDVMEHVPDPLKGFAEIHRVLRPGGAHIFTLPQKPWQAQTVTRAQLVDGKVRHILMPEKHGDPLRAEGALVFTDFANADLAQELARIGLELIEHKVQALGGTGQQTVLVFEIIKPAVTAGNQEAQPC